jgi:hypothetical protein
MGKRNFSMEQYWLNRIAGFEPLLSFKGKTKEDWEEWYKTAYPKYLQLLGEFPRKVELNAEVESSVEDGDLIRERVVFDSEEYMQNGLMGRHTG